MFNGFSPRTIDFMWGLRLNNEKVWFDAHKEAFVRELQLPMKELGGAVFERVARDCPDRGFVCKFSRIYRDARRLRNGEGPYRANMWFCIETPSEAWTANPVFWFELAPEGWSYGLGYYQAKAATMAKLRARIDRDPNRFEQLVSFLDGQDEFGLDGAEYVRKKEAPSEKTAPWYNKKSFSLIHSQPNGAELYTSTLADRVAGGMLSLMPLYGYLITLDSDPTPGTQKGK